MVPLAAIAHDEVEQGAHAGIVRCVENLPMLTRGLDEAGALQLLQMERQSRRQDLEPLRDLTGRHASWPLPDQQTENREPRLVREGGQAGQGLLLFHILTIIKITIRYKRASTDGGSHEKQRRDQDIGARALRRDRA